MTVTHLLAGQTKVPKGIEVTTACGEKLTAKTYTELDPPVTAWASDVTCPGCRWSPPTIGGTS